MLKKTFDRYEQRDTESAVSKHSHVCGKDPKRRKIATTQIDGKCKPLRIGIYNIAFFFWLPSKNGSRTIKITAKKKHPRSQGKPMHLI